MKSYTIGKLAVAAGIGVETVRFYQRKGLLEVPDGGGGVRRYGPDVLDRLKFIRRAKEAGFTLSEIAELLDLDSGSDRARVREMAADRIAALDHEIAQKIAARERLAALAKECARGEGPACPIIASFV